MPRFFFDFVQAGERVPDTLGVELPTVERAYLEAFKAGQEMWSELLKQRRDPRRCSFEVLSQEGDLMFTFPLQEVVDCCTDNRADRDGRNTFDELRAVHNYAKRVRDEFAREVLITRGVLQDSLALARACAIELKKYEKQG